MKGSPIHFPYLARDQNTVFYFSTIRSSNIDYYMMPKYFLDLSICLHFVASITSQAASIGGLRYCNCFPDFPPIFTCLGITLLGINIVPSLILPSCCSYKKTSSSPKQLVFPLSASFISPWPSYLKVPLRYFLCWKPPCSLFRRSWAFFSEIFTHTHFFSYNVRKHLQPSALRFISRNLPFYLFV